MIKNKNTRRFNLLWWIAIMEGSTLLLLIGIAVPLKYLANTPELVHLLGPIHGAIFILYLWSFLNVSVQENWNMRQIIMGCSAAFIPFGGFIVSKLVRNNFKEEGVRL
ncbi:DUF3817 domain-containing protein [Colwellia sp. 6_MG-2023]|uniref:DUF3817 domain-containing protein n=1 Tax=Colwellia sp. 6_MG-2023 TaxID=3062676 RepID=UPI0026E1C61E|nr:DUF3817 domain-containing protein [Colwellia sp. 6_MG-2023]MDO6487974.1 DUF3817 domain-containing protein [Colwellia sp. 6_MG-2023]